MFCLPILLLAIGTITIRPYSIDSIEKQGFEVVK